MTETAILAQVPCGLIDPSPDQNRESFDPAQLLKLAGSIRELGLLQPVKVRARDDRYDLIAGERRLRAVRDVLSWPTILAVVDDVDDRPGARWRPWPRT
jgi:ParB family transcriptional regulator, chromosome partitioning protein